MTSSAGSPAGRRERQERGRRRDGQSERASSPCSAGCSRAAAYRRCWQVSRQTASRPRRTRGSEPARTSRSAPPTCGRWSARKSSRGSPASSACPRTTPPLRWRRCYRRWSTRCPPTGSSRRRASSIRRSARSRGSAAELRHRADRRRCLQPELASGHGDGLPADLDAVDQPFAALGASVERRGPADRAALEIVISSPQAMRPWRARWQASGPAAEPVAASSPPRQNIRVVHALPEPAKQLTPVPANACSAPCPAAGPRPPLSRQARRRGGWRRCRSARPGAPSPRRRVPRTTPWRPRVDRRSAPAAPSCRTRCCRTRRARARPARRRGRSRA